MLLHSGFSRYVVLRPDNVVVKLGSYLNLDEMDAIAFAKGAGIRVPEVVGWGEQTTARKQQYIEMNYIEGDTLERAWPTCLTRPGLTLPINCERYLG